MEGALTGGTIFSVTPLHDGLHIKKAQVISPQKAHPI